MTYDEITLFARFLQDKSMQKNYQYFYENHRFDKRSLDAFFEQTDAEDAILGAFDLAAAPNSIFSPKYWQVLNDKWMKRLQEYRANGCHLEAQTIRCDHCGRMMPRSSFALNAKGQLHKYCRECESGEWDRKRREQEEADKERERQEKAVRQLEKEIAEKQAKLERLTANDNQPAQTTPAPPTQEGKAAADDASSKYSPKLGEYDATLHYKAESKKIVFNAILSAYVYTDGLTKCYLSTDRDGRQFLVFNNMEGANVTWLTTKSSRLAQVCSANHCRQIADRFRLAVGESYYLHVTKNLSKTVGIINIEVKQVHTREEFAAIVERREAKAKAVPGRDVPEWQDAEEDEHADMPLIDFSEEEPEAEAPRQEEKQRVTAKPGVDVSQSLMIPLTGRKPNDILQQLIDRGHVTEDDIATFLYNKGWKLQKPVVVTTHKKFKA